MLETQYRTHDGRLTVKISANDPKDLFEQLARFSEVFEVNTACGHCKSDNTRLSVREVDSNKYYERKCNACGYGFAFGQLRAGGALFPKWQQGWTKYVPQQDEKYDTEMEKIKKKRAVRL